MKHYKITPSFVATGSGEPATKLTVGFSEPATNDAIVGEVSRYLAGEGALTGGRLLLIDGPASLPVAFALAHATVHIFGAVAVKDPKLGAYVVAVSHDPGLPVGSLIRE